MVHAVRGTRLGTIVVAALVAVSVPGAGVSGAQPEVVAGAEPAAAAATLPSAGCGTTTVEPGQEVVDLVSGGVDRQYIRFAPEAHDGTEALPVVVSFHGLAEGAAVHTLMTGYAPIAEEHGFVVVFPQALGSPVAWRTAQGSEDLAFAGDLLDHVEATLCVDTNRIFVSGLSNGGFMTSAVACTYADRIAAIAPVAGLRNPTWCDPVRPVPVLTFHGTADTWVSYNPVPGIVDAWAARNGCDGAPAETFVGADDVAEVTRISHPCPDGAAVEFYSIDGGGHAWPGSEASAAIEAAVGHTTFVISASELAWEFFRAHPLRTDIVSYTARFPVALGGTLDVVAGHHDIERADVVRFGVDIFRALAAQGLAVPGEQAPNDGPVWITVTWPSDEAGAIEAAAAAWGGSGDELHGGGGRLVALIVYLLAVGGG